MSGDDVALLRQDIQKLDNKINDNCLKVAVIEQRLNTDDGLRTERQGHQDEWMQSLDNKLDVIITRNAEVDGWFKMTKKMAGFLAIIIAAGGAVLGLLKLLASLIIKK